MIYQSVTVPFTPDEEQMLRRAAGYKQAKIRQSGIPSGRKDFTISAFEVEWYGLRGEYAAAKAFGIRYDFTRFERECDNGDDLNIGKCKIQVKSTRRPQGRLVIRDGKDRNADIYVLAVDHLEYVTIVGWLRADEFDEKSDKGSFFGPDRPAVTQDRLRPMSELMAMVRTAKRKIVKTELVA